MRAIRIATIMHNMADVQGDAGYRQRITLRLRRDGERYLWRGDEDEHDTGIAGATVAAACDAAAHAWAGSGWDLRARWLQS